MAQPKAHISEEKKKVVKEFTDLINKYDVIAAVNVENLPAKQLNQIRASLRGKADLLMTKKRLLKIALENSKKENMTDIIKYLEGMPALLFTNENPFTLYKILKKSKSPAPIKGGQKTPKDIVVSAGPTNFAPGPIIGELGMFKIKSGVENGKVAVKADSEVAKEGDVINATLAALLTRLEIYPMEIGLNLTAAYEKGNILVRKDLDIDEDKFMADLRAAASNAYALSIARAIPLKENIEALLQNAHRDSLALANSQNIITPETVGKVLAKAESQAAALKSKVPE